MSQVQNCSYDSDTSFFGEYFNFPLDHTSTSEVNKNGENILQKGMKLEEMLILTYFNYILYHFLQKWRDFLPKCLWIHEKLAFSSAWSKSLLQIFKAYVTQSSQILGKNTAPSLKVHFKTPHFAPSEGAKYTSYFRILQKKVFLTIIAGIGVISVMDKQHYNSSPLDCLLPLICHEPIQKLLWKPAEIALAKGISPQLGWALGIVFN